MTSTLPPSLAQRAAGLGVETSYTGVDGVARHASQSTVERVVEILTADPAVGDGDVPAVHVALGGAMTVPVGLSVRRPTAARLDLDGGGDVEIVVDGHGIRLPPLAVGVHTLSLDLPSEPTTTVLVPPPAMPRAADLERSVGLFAPAYALWSADEPLPSVAHLAELARSASELGVDVVATLPLYAAFLDDPFDPSPYSPASRLHWNEVYVDPATLPAADSVDASGIAHGDLTDWRCVGRIRRRQLLDAAAALDPAAGADLDRWCDAHPDVRDYARFRAELAGDASAQVRRSLELGQHLMDRSLQALRDGDGAVLALDLPIGCHPRGYETWAHPEWFAAGTTVGAPPDELFMGGQDWGFPPLLPGASRRSGHALWRDTLARAARHAAVLRIDHVMAVHRLWWIPEGNDAADGVYVRYPAEELLAVVAIAAHRAGTTVVGEDLGTVPSVVRTLMAGVGMLGMHEEQFAVVGGGPPTTIRADVVAGIRTHDMPAFAVAATEPGAIRYAAGLGLRAPFEPAQLLDALMAELGRSDAYMVMVDLEDLIGEMRPHNVPGRPEPSAWRRRLGRPAREVVRDPAVGDRLRAVAAAREELRS